MNQSALMTMLNKIMSVPVGLSVISDYMTGINAKAIHSAKKEYIMDRSTASKYTI